MYKVRMLNVERVVADEHQKNQYLAEGYVLVEENTEATGPAGGVGNLEDLTVEELKIIAENKVIEVPSKIRKEDLIKLIRDAE